MKKGKDTVCVCASAKVKITLILSAGCFFEVPGAQCGQRRADPKPSSEV